MFKIGQKVKFLGQMNNLYGDTDQAVDDEILIPGKFYIVWKVDAENKSVTLDTGNEDYPTWNLHQECIQMQNKYKKNLPEWW